MSKTPFTLDRVRGRFAVAVAAIKRAGDTVEILDTPRRRESGGPVRARVVVSGRREDWIWNPDDARFDRQEGTP